MFWYGPLLNDISFTDKTLQNSIWLLYHIFRKCDEGISLPESLWKWYTFKEILELLGTYWFQVFTYMKPFLDEIQYYKNGNLQILK